MSKLVFGLYDEIGYMQLLADYLEQFNSKVESHLFTQKDSLEKYLKENEVEVLLLGEEVDGNQISYLEHAKHRLVLSEEPIETGESMETKIFKYQPAPRLVEEIFERVLKVDSGLKEKRRIKGKVRFYGIYRLWKNDSLILEQILAKEVPAGKSLIIDMGIFSGFMATEQRNSGLSELLFYLKQQTEKIVRKLSGLIQEWQGVDYLCPVEDYRDLYGITREEMELLLHILSENTDYENVIFDLEFPGEASLYLLGECDFIYLSKPQNEWEKNQRDGFLRLLQKEGMEKAISRITYLSV